MWLRNFPFPLDCRSPTAALLLLEMSASLQELHPNARPTPAPEMNHSRQPYFSNYSFFFFLFFFFYEKDHTEFANKQNSKRNLKKMENNNSPKKQNRSLAFPSLKIVWTRPPVPWKARGLLSAFVG